MPTFLLTSAEDPTTLFDLAVCLGEGTYGEVWKATHKKTKQTFAVKIVEYKQYEMEDLEQEMMILRDSK